MPSDLPAGSHTLSLQLAGPSADQTFTEQTTVQVRRPAELLFLESDKPIYRPGQQIRLRALRLNSDLKPMPGSLEVSIKDAKGIKVHKGAVATDAFGMAETALPLSSEPNLGVWGEYDRFIGQIDGAASFDILPANYVSGVPAAGGKGNVRLDITVREPSTGYEERITKLLTVSQSSLQRSVNTRKRSLQAGTPFLHTRRCRNRRPPARRRQNAGQG